MAPAYFFAHARRQRVVPGDAAGPLGRAPQPTLELATLLPVALEHAAVLLGHSIDITAQQPAQINIHTSTSSSNLQFLLEGGMSLISDDAD